MGIFGGMKNQLRSVIEWENPSGDVLFERWTENGDEIKNASKLIVGPGQGCVFVYEGRVESVLTDQGITNLKTDNIPFWTTITKILQSFESEHKVGIYYFRQAKILDQKWGTPSVVKYEDPKYKFPVGLRAFGNYSFRITDPKDFFVNVVAGADAFRVEDIKKVITSRIVQPLTDFLAEAHFTYAEIDANREEIAEGVTQKIRVDFAKLGFELDDFRLEGTSFDEDTMRRINRIADMSAEAQAAAAAGINYTQMQQLDAMRDAAQNEGGGAGMGMGLGAGIGFGNMMAGSMSNMGGFQQQQQQQQQQQAPQGPPPVPGQVSFYIAVNGQQSGPFDMNALSQQAQQGQLTKESLVWKQGMAEWTAAGSVPELQTIFQPQGPPPPPPPPPPPGQ